MLNKKHTLNLQAKKKSTSALDKVVAQIVSTNQNVGAQLLQDKLICVNQPEYHQEK